LASYRNHAPLQRQSMILERDLGLEISRATLNGWVLEVGEQQGHDVLRARDVMRQLALVGEIDWPSRWMRYERPQPWHRKEGL
jgi:hypothetical protein